jgi:hypothetical protein
MDDAGSTRLRPLGRGLREHIVAAMIDRLVHHAEVITSMASETSR